MSQLGLTDRLYDRGRDLYDRRFRSHNRWLRNNHNEDDPDNCDCFTCVENARDDHYASVKDD
jgi:hypothetical protein